MEIALKCQILLTGCDGLEATISNSLQIEQLQETKAQWVMCFNHEEH